MPAPPFAAQLLVLAKQPRPGRVKTRLSPPLTPAQCADVARAALLDTLDTVLEVPVLRRTVVLDGDPAGLLPGDLPVLAQRPGGLGDRLAGAYTDAYAELAVPMLLVGMDTPQVSADQLGAALSALLAPGTGAVLGHALDGGWWALGLRQPASGVFDGVPMSTDRTGAAQAQRLAALGLATTELPVLRDLDLAGDLKVVAAQTRPGSRTRAVVAALGSVAP